MLIRSAVAERQTQILVLVVKLPKKTNVFHAVLYCCVAAYTSESQYEGCYPIPALSYYYTNMVFIRDCDMRTAVFSVEVWNAAC